MERLWEVYERAFDLEPAERQVYLDEACTDNAALRARVDALLVAADAEDDDFLEELNIDEELLETLDSSRTHQHRAEPLGEGDTIGAYKILSFVARGAMGWVYRARHELLEREVAIKVLGPDLLQEPELVARFFAEAKVVNAIRHPNIIDVSDYIDDGASGRVGYVMPLLKGASLGSVLGQQRLSRAQVLNIAWQLLDGLDSIHAADVVHRDLKPENVFIVGDLETDLSAVPSVIVLDFGVAKIAETNGYRTATGALVGTPAYMAPEQVLGHKVGPPADLYAWALMVLEMLVGGPIFKGSAPAILMAKRGGQAPLADFQLESALHPLLALLQQCLAPSPELRPQAVELRNLLQPLLELSDSDSRKTAVVVVDTIISDEEEWLDSVPGLKGTTLEKLDDATAVYFSEPQTALRFAQQTAERYQSARIGVDTAVDAARSKVGALALARTAEPGGILVGALTAQATRVLAKRSADDDDVQATWISHGRVLMEGLRTPVEVFELSSGHRPPQQLQQVATDRTIQGWRPSPGLSIPGRPELTLVRALGTGGFGEVWVAEAGDAKSVFKFGFDAKAMRSLEREARLYRWLEHALGARQDILSAVELHRGPPPHLEIEYIVGGDLARWIADQGGIAKVAIDERIEFVAMAAEALAAVHAVGVIHRDIKPGNLLVRPDADGPRIVLADFGIGGLTETTEALGATPAAPDSVQLAGTLLYMSPERLAGRPASVQADLYALGVVLFQLLVEDFSRPVSADWRAAIADPVLREDLENLLDEDPSRRMADAGSLARSLRAVAERREARAAAAAAELAAERARRFRRVVIPVLAALVAVFVVVSFQAWRIQREAIRANREASTAARTIDFLVELFETSDPTIEPPTVRQILDRGAARLRVELKEEPVVRARLMSTMGQVYSNLGLYEPAEALSTEALQLRRAALGGEHPDVASSHHQLGNVQRALSRFNEAEVELKKALELRKTAFGAEHPVTAESLNDVAQLAFLRGDVKRAESLYLKSLEIHRSNPKGNKLAVAETASHLGWMYSQLNRFKDAESYLSEALEIRKQMLGAQHFRVAKTLYMLSDVYLFQGKLKPAEKTILETLDIQRAILEPGHRRIGVSLVTLGALRRQQGRVKASEARLREAIALLKSAVGADNLDVGLALYELALTMEQANQHEQVAAYLLQALPIYEKAYGLDHRHVAIVLNNLGSSLGEKLGRGAEAVPYLHRAVRIFDSQASPEAFWQALARWTLANVLRDEGRHAEAKAAYLEALSLMEMSGGGRAENPDLVALKADFARLTPAATSSSGAVIREE